MDENEILKMQWENLIKMYDIHHKRWIDHWRTYLTILAILTAILTALYSKKNGQYVNIVSIFVSIIGIIISISGCISMNRIRNDTDLTFFHLNMLEDQFQANGLKHISIFHNGKEFFEKGKVLELSFKINFTRKVRNIHIALISFILFSLFYVLNIIMSITSWNSIC